MARDDRGSVWTPEALKELFEKLLGEHDRRYSERYAGQEKALAVAREEAKLLAAQIAIADVAYR